MLNPTRWLKSKPSSKVVHSAQRLSQSSKVLERIIQLVIGRNGLKSRAYLFLDGLDEAYQAGDVVVAIENLAEQLTSAKLVICVPFSQRDAAATPQWIRCPPESRNRFTSPPVSLWPRSCQKKSGRFWSSTILLVNTDTNRLARALDDCRENRSPAICDPRVTLAAISSCQKLCRGPWIS